MITSYKGTICFLFKERLEVSPVVPLSYVDKQVERDGNTHHVTLLLKNELNDDFDTVLGRIKATDGIDKMITIGTGHVTKGDDDVFYEVMFWPIGNKIRSDLNLQPKDFHATLGFKNVDLHDVNKGLHTIMTNTIAVDVIQRIIILYNELGKLINDEIKVEFIKLLNYVYDNRSDIMDNDDIVSLLTLRSKIHYALKSYDVCLSDCYNILEYVPQDANVKLRIAHLHNLQNRCYHALNAYKDILKDHSQDAEVINKVKRGIELTHDKMIHSINPRDRHEVHMPDGNTIKLSRNFSWVIPDKLAGISIPKRREEIDAFKFMNIGLVVSVIEDEFLDVKWFDETIKNIQYNVINYHPPSHSDLLDMIGQIEQTISDGKAVLVHCKGGKGRAGSILACYILKNGLSGEIKVDSPPSMTAVEAIETIRTMRPGSIETVQQEQFIKAYCDTLWKNMK